MGIKDHGYYGFAFVGSRPMQFISLVAITGMVGNFIAEISKTKQRAPGELIGTLVIACLAVLWTLLSITAYDDTHIPYLATAGIDTLILIPLIVVAALLGGPLSVTTCSDLPKANPGNVTTYLALPVSTQPGSSNASLTYVLFAGAEQTTCYELMAVWGLAIALCVLFAISAVSVGMLWLGKRRAQPKKNNAGGFSGSSMPVYGGNESQIEMAPPMPVKDFSDAGSFRSGSPGPNNNNGGGYGPPAGAAAAHRGGSNYSTPRTDSSASFDSRPPSPVAAGPRPHRGPTFD